MNLSGGMKGLLEFLKFLDAEGATFSLHRYSDDEITVFFTLVGARVEAAFSKDDCTFSVFRGDESVETSGDVMESLFNKHWRD